MVLGPPPEESLVGMLSPKQKAVQFKDPSVVPVDHQMKSSRQDEGESPNEDEMMEMLDYQQNHPDKTSPLSQKLDRTLNAEEGQPRFLRW